MKKIFLISSLCLALMLLLTGCTNTSQAPAGDNPATNLGKPVQGRMPDFGQPDRPADYRGVVKSIMGNEITILKIDMSKRASTTSGRAGGGKEGNANGGSAPAASLTGSVRTGGAPAGRG